MLLLSTRSYQTSLRISNNLGRQCKVAKLQTNWKNVIYEDKMSHVKIMSRLVSREGNVEWQCLFS